MHIFLPLEHEAGPTSPQGSLKPGCPSACLCHVHLLQTFNNNTSLISCKSTQNRHHTGIQVTEAITPHWDSWPRGLSYGPSWLHLSETKHCYPEGIVTLDISIICGRIQPQNEIPLITWYMDVRQYHRGSTAHDLTDTLGYMILSKIFKSISIW